MRRLALLIPVLALLLCLFAAGPTSNAQDPAVQKATVPAVDVIRAPQAGLMPQACVDAAGTVHLVYCLKGQEKGGDIFYVRMKQGQMEFSEPIRVNSEPGSAVKWSTAGGAQIAAGKGGRIHVAWNGVAPPRPRSEPGAPKKEGDPRPILVTRIKEDGTDFEPQRNIGGGIMGVDGSATIAAGPSGTVDVFWHARGPQPGEQFRAVYRAHSPDEGATFEAPASVNPGVTGACVCCSMRAMADAGGRLFAVYRSAGELVHRDSTLLFTDPSGRSFESVKLGEWQGGICPASSYALAPSGPGVLAAWETRGQISFASFDPAKGRLSEPVLASGDSKQCKHPVILENSRGQRLVAWVDGVTWSKDCVAAWQVYGADHKPLGDRGNSPGVPPSSVLTGFARPDGSFVVIY